MECPLPGPGDRATLLTMLLGDVETAFPLPPLLSHAEAAAAAAVEALDGGEGDSITDAATSAPPFFSLLDHGSRGAGMRFQGADHDGARPGGHGGANGSSSAGSPRYLLGGARGAGPAHQPGHDDDYRAVRALVASTAGWNGADLRRLVREAAYAPLREALPSLLAASAAAVATQVQARNESQRRSAGGEATASATTGSATSGAGASVTGGLGGSASSSAAASHGRKRRRVGHGAASAGGTPAGGSDNEEEGGEEFAYGPKVGGQGDVDASLMAPVDEEASAGSPTPSPSPSLHHHRGSAPVSAPPPTLQLLLPPQLPLLRAVTEADFAAALLRVRPSHEYSDARLNAMGPPPPPQQPPSLLMAHQQQQQQLQQRMGYAAVHAQQFEPDEGSDYDEAGEGAEWQQQGGHMDGDGNYSSSGGGQHTAGESTTEEGDSSVELLMMPNRDDRAAGCGNAPPSRLHATLVPHPSLGCEVLLVTEPSTGLQRSFVPLEAMRQQQHGMHVAMLQTQLGEQEVGEGYLPPPQQQGSLGGRYCLGDGEDCDASSDCSTGASVATPLGDARGAAGQSLTLLEPTPPPTLLANAQQLQPHQALLQRGGDGAEAGSCGGDVIALRLEAQLASVAGDRDHSSSASSGNGTIGDGGSQSPASPPPLRLSGPHVQLAALLSRLQRCVSRGAVDEDEAGALVNFLGVTAALTASTAQGSSAEDDIDG